MKISWRIFCTTYLVIFCIITSVCLVLVEQNNSYAWEKTKEEALVSNATAGQLFWLLIEDKYAKVRGSELDFIQRQIADATLHGLRDRFRIGSIEETAGYQKESFVNQLKEDEQGYQMIKLEKTPYFQVVSVVDIYGGLYYLETLVDLTELYEQREKSIDFCLVVVLVASFIGGIILLLISHMIARPIKKLTKAVKLVSSGDYGRKLGVKGSSELAELAANYNHMAETIRQKIDDLNETIERREQFVANFTHELKTPMTTIIGYADMLRSYDMTRDEELESANVIFREGKRLERLSMQLLEILVLDNYELTVQRINLESFFREILMSLRFVSDKYNVKLVSDIEAVVVEAEPTLISSLFYNLIDNACKASDNGQEVNIIAKDMDKCCMIAVQDYGRGIEKEHIKEVTEPFYMEDKSRSRSQGGAGLGLALCKKIVELHRGTMVVESQLGEGTIVRVYLPKQQGRQIVGIQKG